MRRVALMVLACLFLFGNTASADIIGSVLSTDIKTYIDHILVPSYNIGGSTVVMVRDLERYGYTVLWDEATKTVNFFRDFSAPIEPIIPTYDPLPVGTKVGDVYSTDIQVYFRGIKIPAYNVNGRTAVLVRDLKTVGDIVFDSEKRQVDVFNMEAEYFEDEIQYIKGIFFKYLILLAEGDYMHQKLMPVLQGDRYEESVRQEFSEYSNRLTTAVEAYKEYKEPYGFSASSMELWWAMVNMKYATDLIQKMADNASNGALNPDMGEYNLFRADSYEQRRASLVLLVEDMMGLIMVWD